ncbi:MAG: ABC transporter ATP-binding protein [Candidatus Pacebacteria bacterium]|nr:ABC transporter ATP-binding protein [Candidatus Paceibacterota bacterium]
MSYKVILKYLSNYKKETYLTVILSLLLAGLGALIPAIYGHMFDLIVGGEKGAQLFILLGAWLFAKLASNVMTRFVSRKQFLIAGNCEKDFIVGITAHLLELPMEFHEKEKSGEIFEKISRGGANLNNIINQSIFSTLAHIFTALIVLIIVFSLDYRLGAAILIIIAVFIYEAFKNADPLANSEKELNKKFGDMYGTFGDSIDNVKSIKSFTAEKEEGEKFGREYESILLKYDSLVGMWTRIQMNQSNIMDIGFIAVMGISLFLVLQGALSAGQMIMVLGYTNVIYQPLFRLSDNYVRTQRGMVSVDEGEKIYNERGERYYDELLPVIEGNVRFKKVSFSYNGNGEETLTDLDVEIESGQTVALVGESGAGKSTFVKFISRFIEPENGEVFLDGINISKINLSWLRQNIATVPQNVVLFNGTILDNIRYGRRDASDGEVIEAAKAANAHEFIERMPQKYKQEIGKWGVKLSGGEAQRIAIARAILKNARILILDEATSSLDSGTEKLIKEAIDNLRKEKDKTIIIIAHRFSTIEGADVILVFKKGEIIEQGTHKDLMNKGGEYKRLCDSQSF